MKTAKESNRWSQVELDDQWGHYTWRYQEMDRKYYNTLEPGVVSAARLKWPNEYESFESIWFKVVTNHTSDHGHDYVASTHELYVKVELNGIKVEIPLNKFRIDPTTIVRTGTAPERLKMRPCRIKRK